MNLDTRIASFFLSITSIPFWYGLCLAFGFIVLFVYRLFTLISLSGTKNFLSLFFIYPLVSERRLGRTSRWKLFLLVTYVSSNIAVIAVGPINISAFSIRCARISIMNILILAIGRRLDAIGSLFGLSYASHASLHDWIGRIAILEGLTHAVLGAIESDKTAQIYTDPGFMAAMALVSILLTSLIKSRLYETHRIIHFGLLIVMTKGMWSHMQDGYLPYLILLLSIWATALLSAAGTRLYRTMRGYGRGTISVEQVGGGVIKLHIKIRRVWAIKPGQFIYISIPHVSTTSFLQSHPFAIAWWHKKCPCADRLGPRNSLAKLELKNVAASGRKQEPRACPCICHPTPSPEGEPAPNPKQQKNVVCDFEVAGHVPVDDLPTNNQPETDLFLLVRPRNGFTMDLLRCHSEVRYRVYLDGPYGREHRLDDFGTVILVATGVGIAGVLPYAKNLMKGYNRMTVRTQKIVLLWRSLVRKIDLEWIESWMNEVLGVDRNYILKIWVFLPPEATPTDSVPAQKLEVVGKHDRLTKVYGGEPNLKKVLSERTGATGLLSCVPLAEESKIRELLVQEKYPDVEYFAAEFHPDQERVTRVVQSEPHRKEQKQRRVTWADSIQAPNV